MSCSTAPVPRCLRVFCAAAARGVVVKGLVWRSHLDRFAFSEQENRHLGEEIEAAGGEVLRDMRVRPGGSHHQKFVVLRHPGRPGTRRRLRRRHRPVPQPPRRRDPPGRSAAPADGRRLRRPAALARRAAGDPRAGGRRRRGLLPGALDRPDSADPQPLLPPRRRRCGTRTSIQVDCPISCPTPPRAARTPSRSCGPIRRDGPGTRSRRTASAAWPARIRRSSASRTA